MDAGRESIESLRLIRSANAIQDKLHRLRKIAKITVAINCLIYMAYLSIATVAITEILLVVDLVVEQHVPTWVFFFILFLGHTVLGIIAIDSVRHVLQSLQSPNALNPSMNPNPKPGPHWHFNNDETVPLIQYIAVNLLRILWISLIALLVEILIYLSTLSMVPTYSFLVPIYIMTVFAIISAVVCKSTSISTAISWILLLTTTILLNIEILLPSSIGYMNVLIPTYIIIIIWFIVSIYIIFGLTVQARQAAMAILFSLSLICFFIADICLGLYLANFDNQFLKANEVLILSSVLIGSTLFSIWFILYVNATVKRVLETMAAEKPKYLSKSNEGFWVMKNNISILLGVNAIIGDLEDDPALIEYSDIINDIDESKQCGHTFIDILCNCCTSNSWQHSSSVNANSSPSPGRFGYSRNKNVNDNNSQNQPLLQGKV